MEDKILLAHGSGGKLMHDLIKQLFLKKFNNPILAKLDDMAALDLGNAKVAFTTDTYVVDPLFFPGGDIGKLAICGTVNDLVMSGAIPKYISAAFIVEEGLSFTELEGILKSMAEAAKEAGVAVVTGDTKVVEKGGADKLFINTAGVGIIPDDVDISGSNAKPGDKVILSGTIGDHGIAVMSHREGLKFKTTLTSDCAPLNQLVAEMLKASKKIRCLRDPTRGGLASTLNEFADQSRVGIVVEEQLVPIKEEVLGACEMLGYDPFHIANEGKLVAIVAPKDAEKLVAVMRGNKYGKDATVIGEVVDEPRGKVMVKTVIGATRILDMLVGEQLPRIC
ncbi:MAG TPA: hydrogenase expression/formation protein HypE [Actinobacteria bacterium]|nr:hydrogenase expression/formation protein HypE [Actinomycetota bacterium]